MKKRYAASLLFRYNILWASKHKPKGYLEKRIIVIEASSVASALKKAKSQARRSEIVGPSRRTSQVERMFLGVLDLLMLGGECEENEVWYDILDLRSLKSNTIPPESSLHAIGRERSEKMGRKPPKIRRSVSRKPRR